MTKSNDWCPSEKTHRKESHVKTEAEPGVMQPQARNPQNLEEDVRILLYNHQREHGPADTLILDF